MAGERIRVDVQDRESRGSREARRLRRQGLVPGVLYGRGKAPHAICVPERELRRVLTGPHGLHAILDVVLEGQKAVHPSILKDYQRDPLRGGITHVDLQEVRLDQAIQSAVVVDLVGDAAGVRDGGVLTQATREVTVEALPLDVPDRLELDVSELGVGESLRVADLPPREGVTYLDDPETVLASVTQPTRVVEPEEMLAGEEQPPEGATPGEEPEGGSEAPTESGADAAGSPGTVSG